MTDNEIIKALEWCCRNGLCADCPRLNTPAHILLCKEQLMCEALGLINRQQAEIKSLKELLEGWKAAAYKAADEKDEIYCNAIERVKTAKAEAIKEFAIKLRALIGSVELSNLCLRRIIENLLKEMVGEKK